MHPDVLEDIMARKSPAAAKAAREAKATEHVAYVADTYATMLEAGTADPAKYVTPWHAATANGLPVNAATGNVYRGTNLLWLSLLGGGYWATYRQWQGMGGQVRKGETGATIWRPKHMVKKVDEDGAPLEKPRAFTIWSTAVVHHVSQQDGWTPPEAATRPALSDDPCPAFDAWAANLPTSGVKVTHRDAARAYYNPAADTITLPPVDAFKSHQGYRSTLAHEAGHATGHADRLNRDGITGRHPFGSPGYALEELVAELTSATMGLSLGFETEIAPDHMHYLASWAKAIREDPSALQTAMKQAAAASTYLLQYAPAAAAATDADADADADAAAA